MKTIQELVPLIQEWAKERGIFDESTAFNQLIKTHEEVGELIKACYDNDKPAIQDAVGDVMITLIVYSHFEKNDILEQINKSIIIEKSLKKDKITFALNIQLELTYQMKFLFEESEKIPVSHFIQVLTIFRYLNKIALLENTSLEECLNIAYNEIKNRTGKMINGKFVKDEK